MSPDEQFVTLAALFLGPVLWAVWLFRMSRLRARQRRSTSLTTVAIALAGSAALIVGVLDSVASFDVVDAPEYQFMYLVIGLAWLRIASGMFPAVGLNPRDDIVERGNRAAALAASGALVGVALCYAGGNIGDGPGWWVVVFSAALATATLLAAWAALAQLTPVADAVAIDRDPAAGLRLGAFLLACGLISGRGVAGDWDSAAATVADFSAALPGVAAILICALVVERLARPSPDRPRPPAMVYGVVPALLYLLIAGAAVQAMGWPA